MAVLRERGPGVAEGGRLAGAACTDVVGGRGRGVD